MKRATLQNKQLKGAVVGVWKSITEEECKSLVMAVGHKLDTVIASKGFAPKDEVLFTLIYFNSICSNTFAHLKKMCCSVTNNAIFLKKHIFFFSVDCMDLRLPVSMPGMRVVLNILSI